MKKHWVKVLVIAAAGLVGAAILGVLIVWPNPAAGRAMVARTCAALQREGFKTDLSQFDFSTSPELRAREAALTAAAFDQRGGMPREWPALAESAGNGSRVVLWQQAMLKWPHEVEPGKGDQVTWEEFREVFEEPQPALDAACAAALSGPIRFDLAASHGGSMLLRHLPPLRMLTDAFSGRAMLALHDGRTDAAWTNLMAETRLVTAWEPEPAEVSHLVRFSMTERVLEATWQVFQTNAWTEGQLARLQAEWEGIDFLSKLPETGEFRLACDTGDYDMERRQNASQSAGRGPPGSPSFIHETIQSPWAALANLRYRWSEARYRAVGQYIEERDVLLYDRDREIELRNAVRAPAWVQMRALPGVTTPVPVPADHHSPFQFRRQSRELAMAFQRGGGGLLGRAAQAETERRIVVAVLALERYRVRHGVYPTALASVAPEFLKSEPVDFMDGRPLRYQLNADGHYRVYSVGLDCVDDGGQLPAGETSRAFPTRFGSPAAALTGDIVWPFPAPAGAVAESRRQEMAAVQQKEDDTALVQATAQWRHAASHQADAEKLLAAAPADLPEIIYRGRPVSELLRNSRVSGTNSITLKQMLTLRQVPAGDDPAQVTFELPIAYEALKRIGEVYLLIDTNNDDSDEGCVVQQMERKQADNGDCWLVMDTIFEAPGKHALRAGLEFHGGPADQAIVGPPSLFVVSNLCQFSLGSAHFDSRLGATFQLQLPEMNGRFVLRCLATNGTLLKTISGATTDGIVNVRWDLMDERGRRFEENFFNSAWTITLPDSGRSQNLKGP